MRDGGIPVFAAAGNHDSPRSRTEEGGYCALEVYEEAGLLHFLPELSGDPPTVKATVLQVGEQTVAIAGFSPNLALRENEDLLAGLAYEVPPVDLRVLVTHVLVEGWVHPDAQGPITRPSSLEALRDIDLVIAGDLHDFHSTRFGGVRVVVPGSTEWMDYREMAGAPPGFADIQFEAPGQLKVQHIETAPQARKVIELSVSDLDPSDPTASVVSAIERALPEVGSDPLVLLRLEGVIERDVMGRLDLVQAADQLRDRLSHLDLDLAGLQLRRERGVAAPRGIRRTLRDELLGSISELAGDLDEADQAALAEVEQEILAVYDGDTRGPT